jgi:1A family penicillin-binding protein
MRHIRLFLIGTAFAAVLGAAATGVWVYSLVRDLPNPTQFQPRLMAQSTKIWDRTGTVLLYDVYGEQRRTFVSFADIPPIVKQATLAAEDAGFYQHPAFDLKAIARAVRANLLSRTGAVQGGSTITQQLVKNSFLTPERTLARKLKELVLAIRFEQEYSKDQILEFYLNQVPYGSNVYGVAAASETFFGKQLANLSPAEAATLAAMLQRPSYLSPYGSHTDELKSRQEYVLGRMASLGWISESDATAAKKEKLAFTKQRTAIKAPHFVMYVRSVLDELLGETYLETAGLNVITTLDWNLQQIAEKAIVDGVKRNEVNWHADNAAFIAENPKNGEVLALVGSRDYFDTAHDGNLNVTQRVRQPGSSFKPFVYLAAFEKGYSPSAMLFDLPTEFSSLCNPDGTPLPGVMPNACYHPTNYDEKTRGPVSLRQALAQSLNIPSVKLLYLVGVDHAIAKAQSLGITTLTEKPSFYGLSLILGGGGVKLAEMVNAYGAFSQDGTFHTQETILKVTDAQGSVVYQPIPEEKRIADPQAVRLLNSVLSDDAARVPAFQPNGPLTVPGYAVAAKTGTSQDYRDAWTVGYTPTLAAGVWVGNNDYTPMQKGGAGGMAAAPIWNDFMRQALPRFPMETFPAPNPVGGSKPMLDGNYIIQTPYGPQIHTVLYWVDRSDPLGQEPSNPFADPQFNNWEYGVRQWAQTNFPNGIAMTALQPQDKTPRLSITEPAEGFVVTPSTALQITARVQSYYPIQTVSIKFNGESVLTFPGTADNVYSVFFVPRAIQAQNTIEVTANDTNGAIITQTRALTGAGM